MAGFCTQCSLSFFNEDFGDFVGLSSEEDTLEGRYASIICEGCGPTLVDHTGTCIYHSKDSKDSELTNE